MDDSKREYSALFRQITDIGIALSAEKNLDVLLEMILTKAQELTHADAATIYLCDAGQLLKFEIMFTESLGLHVGGTSEKKITLPPLPVYNEDGSPNSHMVATWVAATKQTVSIDDAYHETAFDFSGTIAWDQEFGYRSKSFLVVPMVDHLNDVIGVLQLINARDPEDGRIVSFSAFDQQLVESLASQAAVSISNRILIDAQKKLFDSLIQLIAGAIDEKSHYTAGHCLRVPVIAHMIADAICRIDKGPLKDVCFTDDEKYELDVAAWLHDCGKITTPEYVVDKATKLETISDRIHLIDLRFEVLKRDAIISSLRRRLAQNGLERIDLSTDRELQRQLDDLDRDAAFIRVCNVGKENTAEEDMERISRIAQRRWSDSRGDDQGVLSDDEVLNLTIYRGTLSIRERDIINNHVVVTRRMLDSLPYPKVLARVPEFAGSHHEKMDGSGYPRGLTGAQMPLQSRIIAVADVFEALTASDRPYKKAMPLSQSLAILGQMKLDGQIDPDVFDVFMHEKLYLTYARQYLSPASIDIDDPGGIPGYKALV
ncbi:HD domain-containing phosphohydrolase [Legionella sp. CNM-4043-24]|uniref:HD domain-containing phosphohydrolase n=1 Tax=Legionella sp. CNM-4043-24 TaxID=3421646 RepID=UPI00403AF4F0